MKDSTKAAITCIFWIACTIGCGRIGGSIGFVLWLAMTALTIMFVYYDTKMENRHRADRHSIKKYSTQLQKMAEENNHLRQEITRAKRLGYIEREE